MKTQYYLKSNFVHSSRKQFETGQSLPWTFGRENSTNFRTEVSEEIP